MKAWSPNHWTAREFPYFLNKNKLLFVYHYIFIAPGIYFIFKVGWSPKFFSTWITHFFTTIYLICCSVAKSCLTLLYTLDCSTHAKLPCPSLILPEFAQTHVHRVSNAIQPSILCIRWPKYWSYLFNRQSFSPLICNINSDKYIFHIGLSFVSQFLFCFIKLFMYTYTCVTQP